MRSPPPSIYIDTEVRGTTSSNHSKTKRNKRTSCLKSEKVLQFDQFGQPLSFNFHRGNSSFRSSSGACLSLLIASITIAFTLQQILVLINYRGTQFLQTTALGYYDISHTFEQDDGLMIAIGLIDGSKEGEQRPFEEYL